MKMDGNEYYLKSAEQMYEAFPGMEDAVSRSQEIADTVDIDLELGKRYFPSFKLPPERNAAQYLRELCEEGLRERYEGDPEMVSEDGVLAEIVQKRLDRELGVIEKLGFDDYFLICWDFVVVARERGIRQRLVEVVLGRLFALHCISAMFVRLSMTCSLNDFLMRIAWKLLILISTFVRIAGVK